MEEQTTDPVPPDQIMEETTESVAVDTESKQDDENSQEAAYIRGESEERNKSELSEVSESSNPSAFQLFNMLKEIYGNHIAIKDDMKAMRSEMQGQMHSSEEEVEQTVCNES